MKLNQKAFSAVEALLIIVIVGILGGTGYYVYHANKTTNDTLSSAAKDASGSPKFVAKKKTPSSTSPSQKSLTINEWGVKIPLSSADAGVYYSVDKNIQQSSSDPTNLTVYSSEVDSLTGGSGVSCKGEYVAYIVRLPSDSPKWAPSQTVDDGNVSPLYGERTVIGNYRYAISTKKQYGPECLATSKTGDYVSDTAVSAKFDAVVNAFTNDFKNITATK